MRPLIKVTHHCEPDEIEVIAPSKEPRSAYYSVYLKRTGEYAGIAHRESLAPYIEW